MEELWIALLASWMAAGWLAEGLVGGGRCWLGGWLGTGTPGAEDTGFGEGDTARTNTFIKKPINITTVD